MTYAQIRQQVLAQLSPKMDPAEIPALLHTLAYIALHGDAQAAAAALLTSGGPDRQDLAQLGAVMGKLESSWGKEISALRAEVTRQNALAAQTSLGSDAVMAILQREFIYAPIP